MNGAQQAEAIFDAIGKLSRAVHARDRRLTKLAQIASCEVKEWGRCDHWTKSSCVPEKQRKEFKSMGSPACKDFVLSYGSKATIKIFREELAAMERTQGDV